MNPISLPDLAQLAGFIKAQLEERSIGGMDHWCLKLAAVECERVQSWINQAIDEIKGKN